jgi:multisubunit Na+/H+ antiporter MnhB subunit
VSKIYNTIGLFVATYTLILIIYGLLLYGSTFPQPNFSFKQISPAEVREIISSLSGFIWDYRVLDVLMLVGVLFASAIGCIAMLRVSGGEK